MVWTIPYPELRLIQERQAPHIKVLKAELEQEKQKRREAEAGLAELTAATAAARVEQAELTRKNQQARRFLTGTVAVSVLMVAGAVATATRAGYNATVAQREANQVRVEAQQQQTAAEYEVSKADFQVGTATLREGVAQRRSEAAVQREEEAQTKVEEAETRLAEIDQQAKAELDAAQAAVQSAQDQVAQAEAQQAQAKTDLAAAETAKDTALALQRRAREGTRLERAGVAASQRFAFQETEGLLAALRAVSDLRGLNQEFGITALADYPAASPLLALQTSLDRIRETRVTGHQGPVNQVLFSPNGEQIATSGEDGTARLWDLGGNEIAVMEGHQGRVRQVLFSPDGNQIATRGEDGTARLWDLGGNEIAVMEGHQGRVRQVLFSPDGNQIATSGEDGTTRIWAINGQQIAQYEGSGTIRDDWRYVATILQPRSPIRDHAVIKLWPISDIDQLIARACTRLTPFLTHNPDVTDADRALCNLPPLTP